MFYNVFYAKIIACIIVILFYFSYMKISLKEFDKYITDINRSLEEYILTFSMLSNKDKNAPFIIEYFDEIAYIESLYNKFLSEFSNICFNISDKYKFFELFNYSYDNRMCKIFEPDMSKNYYYFNIQHFNRMVNPFSFIYFSDIYKYINDIPTIYDCKYLILNPKSEVKYSTVQFVGYVTSFTKLLNCDNIEICATYKKKEKKKEFNKDTNTIVLNSDSEIIIKNNSNEMALMISGTFMRICRNQHGNLLLNFCDKISKLYSRFIILN